MILQKQLKVEFKISHLNIWEPSYDYFVDDKAIGFSENGQLKSKNYEIGLLDET